MQPSQEPQFTDPIHGEIARSVLCSAKLQGHAHWKPETTLNDGLTQTILWAQAFYA